MRYWILLFIIFSVSLSDVFYPPSSSVVSLTPKNFDSFIKKEPFVIVEFYAPWCGHCKALKPEYIKASKSLVGLIPFAAVNCDEEANKVLASRYSIKGFPTIKIFSYGHPTDYNGPRSAKSISDHLISIMPSKVKSVTVKNYEKFFSTNQDNYHIILFSKHSSTTPLYKKLSVIFSDLTFGEVKKSENKLINKFEIEKFPSLLIFKPNEMESPVHYEGQMKSAPLRKYLSQYSNIEVDSGPVLPQLYDQSCFETHCPSGSSLCVILILSKEIGNKEVEKYKDLMLEVQANQNTNIYNFVWMNSTDHNDFITNLNLEYDSLFPQLIIVSVKKNKMAKFVGSFTANSITDFCKDILSGSVRTIGINGESFPSLTNETTKCKSKPKPKPTKPKQNKQSTIEINRVSELTVNNFTNVFESDSPWMILFYSPSCDDCDTIKLEYEKAASISKGWIKYGIVNTENDPKLSSDYDIKKLPSIISFPAKKILKNINNIVEYKGPKTSENIHKYALDLIDDSSVNLLTSSDFQGFFSQPKSKILLFSNKKTIKPLFAALSTEFSSDFLFAQIHESESDMMNQFHIKKVPSILFIHGDVSENNEIKVTPYRGVINYDVLSLWCSNLTGKKEDGDDESIPIKPVEEIVNNNDYKTMCFDSSNMCLITFLSEDYWPSNDNTYKELLEGLASIFRKKPIKFLWSDKYSQSKLIKTLHIPDESVAIIVNNPKKNRYAVYIGALNLNDVGDWVHDLLNGRVKTQKLGEPLSFEEKIIIE